ncbi:hypothetical protein [Treponema sp.]|uniref:hypothetical protein n=1 Tax=Treponema sp. TaxID=166 RepID=UPI003F0C5D39
MTEEVKFVDQYMSEPEKRFKESLEKADIQVLDDFLEKNKSIKQILDTPAKELMNTEYKYLISSINPKKENVTLYALICSAMMSIVLAIKSFFYIDVKTKELKGTLICSGPEIVDIKMFSFDIDHPNVALARDLSNLIPELKEKYTCIKWDALKENPANKAYQKIARENGGSFTSYKDRESGEEFLQYIVPGIN